MKIPFLSLHALARLAENAIAVGKPTPLDKLLTAEMTPLKRHLTSRFVERLTQEIVRLETSRAELIKRHGQPVKDENDVIIRHEVLPISEGRAAFESDLTDLLGGEIELEGERLSLADLDGVRFDHYELSALGFLFIENE